MAVKQPIIKEMPTINGAEMLALSKEILAECTGKDIPLVEQSLIWSYLNVARGMRLMPQKTVMDRAMLIHHRALNYLCEQIIAVGAMSDGEVEAYCKTMNTSVM